MSKVLGVVSAGDIKTAKAAEEILKLGGNAYDAMCASLLAAPLCEPILTSLAGGGFMLCAKDGEEPIIYDFFVDVPEKSLDKPEFFPIDIDFGTTKQEFHIGCGSAAVPGVVKGIWEVYKDLCTLPFDEIIKPAYRYAKEGIYLSKIQADFIKLLSPIYLSTKSSKELYIKNGSLIDEKHLYTNEEYADFLKLFAKEGEKLFYEGEVAKSIEGMCIEHKGLLNRENLKNYQVVKKAPLKFSYKEYDLFTNPPPSSGGILIAFALLLLEDEDLGEYGSQEYFKKLISSQKITGKFRKERVDEFLHSNNLQGILKERGLLDAFKDEYKKELNLWGNTTHISILDSFGNAASCTTSNGEACGHIIPGTGIMLNNMLGEEDLNPHGFFKWKPGIRLPSMMSPTALYKDEELVLALGSAGSNRIRSAILQTILNYTHFEMDLQEAINRPRIHYEGGVIFCEPPLKVDINGVEDHYKLNCFKEKNLFFGGVQAVGAGFEGGADKRRGAVSIVINEITDVITGL